MLTRLHGGLISQKSIRAFRATCAALANVQLSGSDVSTQNSTRTFLFHPNRWQRQAGRGFQLLEVRLFGEDTIRLVEHLTIEEVLHNSRLQ